MEKICIKYNDQKVTRDQVDDLVQWLEDFGKIVTSVCGKNCVIPAELDLLIVMGGDGTLLGGARAAAAYGVPVIGVDFGGLGFLSEIKYKQARSALAGMFQGDYRIEERYMLEASIIREDMAPAPILAVNDFVIAKHSGRMLRLKLFINNLYFHEFPGDGLILSTATGSTAYALSAGGPILSPDLDVISITPICPHTLFARAIVTSRKDTLRIELPPEREDLLLIVDGQEELRLRPRDAVAVRIAETCVRLVRVTEPHFYNRVREKFNLT
jgi:NAD+ kinase